MGVATAPLDLTPFLGPERAVFLELLGDLPAADWAEPTECPAWNVKGVALHILGDDLSLLTRRRDASIDSLTPARVVVHALAAWLRNYEAPVGSTIAVAPVLGRPQ